MTEILKENVYCMMMLNKESCQSYGVPKFLTIKCRELDKDILAGTRKSLPFILLIGELNRTLRKRHLAHLFSLSLPPYLSLNLSVFLFA